MKRSIYNLAFLLAAAFLPATLYSASTTGMLRSSGGVSVNGAPVTPVTTVFSGDRIETAPQAGGNLTVGGSSLSLSENSSLLFTTQGMDFQCGGGTIQTSQGLAARFGRTTIKPAKDAARYRVQQNGASLQVTALDGDLSLTEGAREFNLPAGKSATVAYNGCVAQMAKADVQDAVTKTQAADGGTPPPIGPANNSTLHGVITGSSVIAGVTVTGVILVNQNPASPSHP